jgi:hypothetical protein
MAVPERISASRLVSADAHSIFALITDPAGHVRIDGSGMLMAAPDAQRLAGVGDTFEMDMDREPLGDVPLGRYRVINTVTRFVQDRELAWNVAWPGLEPIGHVYGYLLEPSGNETIVSSFCDWSDMSDEWRGHHEFPVVPAVMLERSLENLEREVSRGSSGPSSA